MKPNISDYIKDRLLRIKSRVALIDDAHLAPEQKARLSTACDNADYKTICELLEIADGNTHIYRTDRQHTSSIELLIMNSLRDDIKNECISSAYRNVLDAATLFVNDEIPYSAIILFRISGKLEEKDPANAAQLLASFLNRFLSRPDDYLTDISSKSAITRYLDTARQYLNILEPGENRL